MRKIIFFLLIVFINSATATAQELNAKVSVIAARVGNNVNKSTFTTLEKALNNFINNRKWTQESVAANEKIDCSFLLSLESTDNANIYNASLSIQAARPVYNTTYLSPIINYKDDNITFKYIEFQQLEFNENRVTGSDAAISNLTAVFAYYTYMILAFDYESFGQRGGEPYFQKAQNIVNNAPDGRGISGWKAFESQRNRYWLTENMLNSRYAILHDVYYNYYRNGMDKFFEDENLGRTEVLNALNLMNSFISDNPNTMIAQFFFQGKATELIKVFSKAAPQDKTRASELLQRLDITSAARYKEELK